MSEHDVVIAGGGPTGTMLGSELTLAGVDVVVVERRAQDDAPPSRAGGLHARSIEVLDQRGVAERFLEAGQVMQTNGFAGVPLDISDFPVRRNHGLALWQPEIEAILAGWAQELGVPVRFEAEVTGFTQDDAGVDVELSDGSSLRAAYLVGCDGGRSLVRKKAGIEFAGWDPTTSWMIAELDMDDPEVGMRREGGGLGPVDIGSDKGPYRVVLAEQPPKPGDAPSEDELRATLVEKYGSDFNARDIAWLSRFSDVSLQAVSYREGRVLLAGDSAHIHAPTGGQGLNTGVQDAVNLGWKLAQVVQGTSGDDLLDTYQAERHPVAARVLQNTMAMVAMVRPDDRSDALRAIVTELLALDEPRTQIAAMLAGLDIHYDLGEGHPLLGRRMPDLDLVTPDGPTRVYELLHEARPVLLTFGPPTDVDLAAWPRVRRVDADPVETWALPVIGPVEAPTAVLIRPDGHVAWVGEGDDTGLADALATWF